MASRLTKIIACATLAGVVGGGAVYAHQGHGKRMERAERMFERMDMDKDGIATVEDVKVLAATRFAAMDANGDGEVTRSERREHRKARRAERRTERFARLDADGDGMISLEDMQAAASKRVERRLPGSMPMATAWSRWRTCSPCAEIVACAAVIAIVTASAVPVAGVP